MSDSPYLNWSDALRLPLPARLAWGGTVADRILELFSPRLRVHFHLQEGLDLVWRFAATQSNDDRKQCRHLVTLLSRQVKKAQKEGYAEETFYMVMELLGEAVHGGGAGCTNAVDYASTCYLCYQGYRQGIDPADPSFPDDYASETSEVLYRFSLAVFRFVSANNPPPERAAFLHLRPNTAVVTLPPSVIRSVEVLPPEPEVRYFRAIYG